MVRQGSGRSSSLSTSRRARRLRGLDSYTASQGWRDVVDPLLRRGRRPRAGLRVTRSHDFVSTSPTRFWLDYDRARSTIQTSTSCPSRLRADFAFGSTSRATNRSLSRARLPDRRRLHGVQGAGDVMGTMQAGLLTGDCRDTLEHVTKYSRPRSSTRRRELLRGGEFMCSGPSGCGKSTLLRMIAGA